MTKARTSVARWMAAIVIILMPPSTAWSQVLSGGLPRLPDGVGSLLERPVDRLTDRVDSVGGTVLQAPSRLARLVRGSEGALEADPQGWPVVSGEIVAVGLSRAARAEADRLGYGRVREEILVELNLTVLVLSPPRGQRLSRAVERLAELDPEAEIDFNHVHVPAGTVSGIATSGSAPLSRVQARAARLGLIDTGVAAHPTLSGTRVVQRGFAGAVRPAAHGTAVASLLVGRTVGFAGAAPGAELRVADVYGGQPTGGSSTALARALAWMAGENVEVINVSLVGPRNPVVARAVAQVRAKGIPLVAAVGNDGPAAPPLYPAAYEGVIGVAAVNGRHRPLPESGRGPQVDFAAPGADMAAAGAGGGFVGVRGSSFAAPLVAGLIARHGENGLTGQARDLGARGRDDVFGRGLVGETLAIAPRSVGARGNLRP